MEAELSDAEEQLDVPAAIEPTHAPKPRALGVSARLGRGRSKGISIRRKRSYGSNPSFSSGGQKWQMQSCAPRSCDE